MSTERTRPAFDAKERARIRRGLRGYMEQHRIGTPTLQLRIMEADEPHRRELPLSTLQRFITGSHRTSDAYVEMCHQFLERVGAADEPELGSALAAFFGGDPDRLRASVAGYAGSYVVRAKSSSAAATLPHAYARFAPADDDRYLRAAETAHDISRPDAPARRHRYEGAVVFNPPVTQILLRSCLTRQTKSYLLRDSARETSGRAIFEGAAIYADLENEIRQLDVRLELDELQIGGVEAHKVAV